MNTELLNKLLKDFEELKNQSRKNWIENTKILNNIYLKFKDLENNTKNIEKIAIEDIKKQLHSNTAKINFYNVRISSLERRFNELNK